MPDPAFWDTYTREIEVTFPASNQQRDVAHGLGVVPRGFLLVWSDGPVFAEPGKPWTVDLAWLRSSVAGTRARVIFYTLREGVARA